GAHRRSPQEAAIIPMPATGVKQGLIEPPSREPSQNPPPLAGRAGWGKAGFFFARRWRRLPAGSASEAPAVSDAIDVTRSLPQAPRAQYRRGALLVAGAAVAWSSAGVLARTTAADGWTMLFWRSVFAGLFVLAYIGLREGRAGYAAFRRLDRTGWGVALTFALSSFCFILALEET